MRDEINRLRDKQLRTVKVARLLLTCIVFDFSDGNNKSPVECAMIQMYDLSKAVQRSGLPILPEEALV